jgi:hypothetical protein
LFPVFNGPIYKGILPNISILRFQEETNSNLYVKSILSKFRERRVEEVYSKYPSKKLLMCPYVFCLLSRNVVRIYKASLEV